MTQRCFGRNAGLAAAAALTGLLAGCSADDASGSMGPQQVKPVAVRRLDPTFMWYGDNAERLNAMLDEKGSTSADYDETKRPIAVFDWDNTVIKNDIGDAVTFWMLKNDKILQPPGKDWSKASPYLTPAAAAALNSVCGMLAEEGKPLPTSTDVGCADEILSVYYNGADTGGQDAFEGWNRRTMEPGYAWAVQLQAGYTPAEINGFAEAAITENLAAEIGAVQTVGQVADLNGYLRIYDQIKDLIGALQDDGFDVWVVSASSQHIVEPFAKQAGIAADHVIGVRAVIDAGGKTTYNLQGCGSVSDGTNDGAGKFTGNSLMTYIDGKRCWINKVIHGDTTGAAEDRIEDASKRHVLGAGDSDTDVSFLQDATALRLVINRNKEELMCNAYANAGGSWLVNPMFIKPKGAFADGYACSKDACSDESGADVACVDENGKAIADQTDTVFCNNGVYCEQ